MAKIKSPVKTLVKKEVAGTLAQLESLKILLGQKKFQKRVEKATKLLTANLPKVKKSKKTEQNSNTIESHLEHQADKQTQSVNE
jgi:hypothetical protein